MEKPTKAVTRSHVTQFLFIIPFYVLYMSTWPCSSAATQELVMGFKATPSLSILSFQPLLNDPTGNFSLCFLRINQTQLALTVIHLPSHEPLWQANPTSLFRWSKRTQLFFNGSLVVSDTHSALFWSTGTQGDKVVLINTSNLQVQKLEPSPLVLWQSFDFPTNTLVENQNFTYNMSLVSSNGLYSMRLGDDFMALYAKFEASKNQIYWKHRALQAKADIVEGKGPICARVNSDGYLGMYQTSDTPVDVQAFYSFQRPIKRFLLVRLEPDGNLKAYYWDEIGTKWVLDYQAIADTCRLPSPCGSYGLCRQSACSCLDNQTEFRSGECFSSQSGDFCSNEAKFENDFWVLRRKGVELPFKELMKYATASSFRQCESLCEHNCSCWGAVYNNATGFCYFVDYPIQTVLGVGDEGKMGYFKVRRGAKKKMKAGFGIGFGVLGGALVVLIGVIGFGSYNIWKRRRGVKQILEEEGGVSPGPYKDLGSASFRSIEMCNR